MRQSASNLLYFEPLDQFRRLPRRNVHDVTHKVTAVGSRTVDRAKEFIGKFGNGDKSIVAYGTYQEVYKDKVCSDCLSL